MKVWNYHEVTGEYTGIGQAEANPRNPEFPLIPAFATPKEVPAIAESEVAVFDSESDEWEVKADFRGVVFNKATGQRGAHTTLGLLPNHLTTRHPKTQWDKWSEELEKWQTNTKARQQDLCQRYCTQLDAMASTVRKRFISGDTDVMQEYHIARDEAQAFKAAGYKGDIPDTIQSDMEFTGHTPQQAADSILAEYEQGNIMLKAVRRIRLNGKATLKALPEDTTEEQFKAEYNKWHTQLDAIKPAG